jgi:KaiC/GvpD/RAD55 family RecA-like ATPase
MSQIKRSQNLESRDSTGIDRLDEILAGGFPRPSVTALIGAPGCGTTSFCKRFVASSLKAGRRVLLVCADEPTQHYLRNFDSIESFDTSRFIEEKKLFTLDAYEAFTSSLGIHDYTNLQFRETSILDTVLPLTNNRIRDEAGPPYDGFNIVIDSITALAPFIGLRDVYQAILETQKLARECNHIFLFTGHDGALEGNFVQALRKHVDGVITMRMHWVRTRLVREMIIEKMGFTEIKQPVIPFRIGEDGIEVTQ